jgi:hypothetical protein
MAQKSKPAQDKTVQEIVSELRRGVDLLDAVVQQPPPAPAPVGTTFTLAAGLANDKRVFRIVVHGPVDAATKVTLRKAKAKKPVKLNEVKRDTGELVMEAKLKDLSAGQWVTRLRHGGKLQRKTTTEVL